jgi:tryptophan-rich sensory protein
MARRAFLDETPGWRIDRLAGALLVPYVLWVAYATLLNASLWLLNRA